MCNNHDSLIFFVFFTMAIHSMFMMVDVYGSQILMEYIYIYIYELQPKFRLMESSIRAVSILWKLSWGLENDSTLIKKTITFTSSSTAQGGGGSFKNRKPIGEVGCCESGMAERILMERKVIDLSHSFSLFL